MEKWSLLLFISYRTSVPTFFSSNKDHTPSPSQCPPPQWRDKSQEVAFLKGNPSTIAVGLLVGLQGPPAVAATSSSPNDNRLFIYRKYPARAVWAPLLFLSCLLSPLTLSRAVFVIAVMQIPKADGRTLMSISGASLANHINKPRLANQFLAAAKTSLSCPRYYLCTNGDIYTSTVQI